MRLILTLYRSVLCYQFKLVSQDRRSPFMVEATGLGYDDVVAIVSTAIAQQESIVWCGIKSPESDVGMLACITELAGGLCRAMPDVRFEFLPVDQRKDSLTNLPEGATIGRPA